VKTLAPQEGDHLVDLACGTGDVALAALRAQPDLATVIGIDFSEEMLRLARRKFEREKVSIPYEFIATDVTDIPLEDSSAQCATIAFGIRNVVNVPQALREINRILVGGGRLMILEFSEPRGRLFGPLFEWYFHKVLPVIGGWVSGRKSAYSYLPESVQRFYTVEEITELMQEAGFDVRSVKRYTFGIAVAYLGVKSTQS
jgi:demethylmenaquinone methyltransferase/2-methoxy-6-polyprenyl-1,4-benzoquinol methylase